MISNEILIKRLSYIKQLFKLAKTQSYQHESIAVFSILTFHDSIEMFLKLLSEHKNINSSKFGFLDYWGKIPNLTLKESMRSLNSRRVNIKHKGLLPAKSEIEITRVNTIDFFEQNTKLQFGIEFENISLTNLITYEKVKKYLKNSQEHLKENKFEKCIEKVAFAFEELLYTYENNKSNWGDSPFLFGEDMRYLSSFHLGISNSEDDIFNELKEFIDNVTTSIESLQKAVKITSLGIEYKEYAKFKILTPIVHRINEDEMAAQIFGEKKWTPENCQFCIDFVLDSALKLQEFDFDIESLEEIKEFQPKFNV